MDEEKRALILMGLSEQSQKKLESRRGLEWKLKLGLWAAILLITQFLVTTPSVLNPASKTVIVVLYVLFGILDLVITASMQRSHLIDQAFHLYYRSKVDALMQIGEAEKPEYPDIKKLRSCEGYWEQARWIGVLWLPTACLVACSLVMILKS